MAGAIMNKVYDFLGIETANDEENFGVLHIGKAIVENPNDARLYTTSSSSPLINLVSAFITFSVVLIFTIFEFKGNVTRYLS